MPQAYWIVIVCGVLALIYGAYAYSRVMAAGTGTARMQEIPAAVQGGARAYLNRQNRPIAMAPVLVASILAPTLATHLAIAFITRPLPPPSPGYITPHTS